MDSQLRRWIRIAATGLGFAFFGLLGVGLTLVAFPLLRLLPGTREERELRSQRAVHWAFRAFNAFMRVLGICRVTLRGVERLREPGAHLVVANHPTLIDVTMLGALMPQLDCVAKSATWSNPFMMGTVKATGYLANDDGPALVDAGSERLQKGRSLLLFPEGTRSPRGGLQRFQRGAAHLALRTGLPLLPVLITCDPPSLMKGQKWWDVPPRKMHFSIEVCDPIHVKELVVPGEPRARAARRVTAVLRDFYAERLHYAEAEKSADAVQARDTRLGDRGAPA